MTANVMRFNWELIYMLGGAAILALFAILLAIQQRPKVLPGSQGHRGRDEEGDDEEIRADGYIDSFARTIEEAGGSLPLIVKIAIPGVLLWWLLYLILFWNG